MNLPEALAKKPLIDVLEEHPPIGEILKKYKVDCVSCRSSSCLLKNVIATHGFLPKRAAELRAEIEAYLARLPGEKVD